ncbi:MAG: PAS domain-containing protein [Ardenticatenaceae bacterium]|nr:PAS domain-containing protein [Ardenticatenaceae bacterium]
MIWQFNPYAIPVLLGAFVSVLTAVFVWRRGGSQVIISLVILLSAVEWLSAYALELLLVSLKAKIFWNQMQYIGGTILASGMLVLALQSMGKKRWLTWRNLFWVNLIPIIGLLFIFTNKFHSLVWPEHFLITEDGYIWLDHPHGIVYWIYVAYIQLLILVTILLMVWTVFQSQPYYRRQASMILLGLLIPFTVSLVEFAGVKILRPLNLIQMSYVLAIIPIIWGLMRLQIGDLIPVARAAVFDGIDDCVIVLDRLYRIIDANASARALFQSRYKDVISKSINDVWPTGSFTQELGFPDVSLMRLDVNRPEPDAPFREIGKEIVLGDEDHLRTYDMRISPLTDWQGDVMSHVIVMRDVTERVHTERVLQKINEQLTYELGERRRAESKIKESLTEKEILLKEIHHRVKNNLQVVSSMLSLQSSYATDKESLSIFQDSQNRVRSMALIHEKLYQSGNLAQIDFHDYVLNLIEYLTRSYQASGVEIKVAGRPIFFEVDTAVSCGLILNELVSNAFKHAFPGNRPGRIDITLQQESPTRVCLEVADNGVGLPPDLDIQTSPSLGLQLVNTLVNQLDGTIQVEQSNGVQFLITCPIKASALS